MDAPTLQLPVLGPSFPPGAREPRSGSRPSPRARPVPFPSLRLTSAQLVVDEHVPSLFYPRLCLGPGCEQRWPCRPFTAAAAELGGELGEVRGA